MIIRTSESDPVGGIYMNRFEAQLVIRESHLDLFGHINNATYMQIFEDIRWDAIVSRGFDVKQIQRSKTGPIILECTIKFLKEVTAREVVTVTVESLFDENGQHAKVFKLKQAMLRINGEVACEAIFTYGLFDLTTRRLIEPTPEWRKAIGLDSEK